MCKRVYLHHFALKLMNELSRICRVCLINLGLVYVTNKPLFVCQISNTNMFKTQLYTAVPETKVSHKESETAIKKV